MTKAGSIDYRGALEAVERILNRGGGPDEVLRAVLEALRARAGELDAMIALERETLLILDDRYGVRWEITTRVREDPRAAV